MKIVLESNTYYSYRTGSPRLWGTPNLVFGTHWRMDYDSSGLEIGVWEGGGGSCCTMALRREGDCQRDCPMGAIDDRQTSWIIMDILNGITITGNNTCKRAPVATASIP